MCWPWLQILLSREQKRLVSNILLQVPGCKIAIVDSTQLPSSITKQYIGVGRCFCVGGLLCAARARVVRVHAHPGEFASSEMNSGAIWGNIITVHLRN